MAWVDGKWIEEDDSVANNLTGLLADDSKYIQQARAGGVRTAAKRGLLNSSIAAGSGESAAISAALPIASQDASTIAQKNAAAAGFNYQTQLSDQTFNQQKQLNDQQIAGQKDIAQINNDAEAARQKEQQGFQLTQQERDNIAQAERLKEQIAAADRQAALQSETTLKATEISSKDQLTGAYLQAVSNLSANSKLKAADRNAYIAEFQRVTGSSAALKDSLSKVTPVW